MLAHLSVTALALASEDISLDAEPEEGKSAEMAAALDAFSDAKKKAEKTEQEAVESHQFAEEKLSELREAALAGVDEEVRSDIEAAALDVMELANRAARRQTEAQAKMEDAAKKAEAVGAPPEEDSKVSEEEKKVEKESNEENEVSEEP